MFQNDIDSRNIKLILICLNLIYFLLIPSKKLFFININFITVKPNKSYFYMIT